MELLRYDSVPKDGGGGGGGTTTLLGWGCAAGTAKP